MDAKIKHLEFVQSAINRMAGNSFLLKGWAITLTGGLLVLSFKEINKRYLYISILTIFFLWLLDAYYLSRERRFIALYNIVRKKNEDHIDFSMEIGAPRVHWGWLKCMFSTTLMLFYGGLVTAQVVACHYI
jgi:MTH538 TIR-like domain (DUF1863)